MGDGGLTQISGGHYFTSNLTIPLIQYIVFARIPRNKVQLWSFGMLSGESKQTLGISQHSKS